LNSKMGPSVVPLVAELCRAYRCESRRIESYGVVLKSIEYLNSTFDIRHLAFPLPHSNFPLPISHFRIPTSELLLSNYRKTAVAINFAVAMKGAHIDGEA
jgi:hypothetical protein